MGLSNLSSMASLRRQPNQLLVITVLPFPIFRFTIAICHYRIQTKSSNLLKVSNYISMKKRRFLTDVPNIS